MTPITTFAGRTVAPFGLGRSGLATSRVLAVGALTLCSCRGRCSARSEAAATPVFAWRICRLQSGAVFAALVLAPGVPLTHPEPHWTVVKARTAGVEVIGDIELFCRERAVSCPDGPVAITGTNGKSTTDRADGAPAWRPAGCDGTIGRQYRYGDFLTLEPPGMSRIDVIEMSSFQIELTPSLDPSIGVLLKITPTTSTVMAPWRTTPPQGATGRACRPRHHRRGRRLVPGHRRAPSAHRPQLGRHPLCARACAAWMVRRRQRAGRPRSVGTAPLGHSPTSRA